MGPGGLHEGEEAFHPEEVQLLEAGPCEEGDEGASFRVEASYLHTHTQGSNKI